MDESSASDRWFACLPVGHDHQNVIGVLLLADLHCPLDQRHKVGGPAHGNGGHLFVVDAEHLWRKRTNGDALGSDNVILLFRHNGLAAHCLTFESEAGGVHVFPVDQVEARLVRALFVAEPVDRDESVGVKGRQRLAHNLDYLIMEQEVVIMKQECQFAILRGGIGVNGKLFYSICETQIAHLLVWVQLHSSIVQMVQ
jgi:hypothetical protein